MIFFIYGEDDFRSLQKAVEIKKKFLLSDPAGSGLSVFDWEQKDNKEGLLDTLSMPNLLAPKRLVIVKNMIGCATEAEKDDFAEYFKKNEKSLRDDRDLVMIFWEKGQPKKNGKIFKLLDKLAKGQNFEKLAGARLNGWITERIKKENPAAGISPRALEKLVLFVGNETGSLDKELQKLIDFSDGRTIEEGDVDLLVKSGADISIFNTIDALAGNNKKEALRLLHEHLKRGEDAFYILSMFIYQFRNLLKVADSHEEFRGNEYALAKAIGLHPYVVKKSLQQLRNFPLAKLKSIYQKMADLDRMAKTGRIDIRLALDKFIVEL